MAVMWADIISADKAVVKTTALFGKKFNRVVGGRALIRSELCGKDDAYEYI